MVSYPTCASSFQSCILLLRTASDHDTGSLRCGIAATNATAAAAGTRNENQFEIVVKAIEECATIYLLTVHVHDDRLLLPHHVPQLHKEQNEYLDS